MIDEKLLHKLPKKYQCIIEELYKNSMGEYAITLNPNYTFKWNNKSGYITPSFTQLINELRNGLNQPVTDIKGGKREGAGRKNKGYKMVSIRMTEEEKIAVKEYLKEIRKDEH